MPKSCKKRKIKKLQQAVRLSDGNSIDVFSKNQKISKTYKQRVREFFKSITTRPNASRHGTPTCANNNNQSGFVVQAGGDPTMATYLEDIRVTTERNADSVRKAERTENDMFEASHSTSKQGMQHVTTHVSFPHYTAEQALLVSALIAMLDNEPTLQDKTRNSDDLKEARDKVDTELVKYVVGQSIYTGKFNLKVLDTIGEGSQATIFKVAKENTVLAAKISKNPAFTKYLVHEYELLSTLSHDNIVTLHDQVPDGFLMDILQEDLINHMRLNFDFDKMRLPLRDQITVGILKAVNYLHTNDIAHLDIKPENILLTADGVPKLADFGLALRVRDADGNLQTLKSIRGSLPYLSPEVLSRKETNSMTEIDAWAVGVLMYTMLTGGKLPFGYKSAREIYQRQSQRLRLPHRVKAAMKNDSSASSYFCIIFQLLNFQPEMRPSVDSALRMIFPFT